MTAIRLRNELNKLIAKGWGRSKVCVNKPTFAHNCEGDGCVILDVEQVIPQRVIQMQEDGSSTDDKGMEHYRKCVVIVGDRYDPESH